MCGRFTLSYAEHERLSEELGVPTEQIPAEYQTRYNIAPTDLHYIVRLRNEERQLLPAKWGLVNTWAKDAKRAAAQINARDVTVARLPAFREAFERRRCVIPADGFFEWTGTKETRLPHWYHRSDGRLLLFAGLHESWQPSPDKWERTFTIITTAANAVGSPVHDRMPAILEDEAVEEWLYAGSERESPLGLLRPAPDDLLLDTAVSQRVNSVKNDDPDCLAEIARLS